MTSRKRRFLSLSRSSDFARVRKQGRSYANRSLVLLIFPAESAGEDRLDESFHQQEWDSHSVRLGLSVSRRIGDAVTRNRIKRVLREAFHAEMESLLLKQQCDLVLVARSHITDLDKREGMAGIRTELRELLSKTPIFQAKDE